MLNIESINVQILYTAVPVEISKIKRITNYTPNSQSKHTHTIQKHTFHQAYINLLKARKTYKHVHALFFRDIFRNMIGVSGRHRR